MPWFRVDDDLAFHRKTVAAGNAAMGMWVRAGSWCAQTLTDGFVPAHMIAALGNKAQARKLVSVGLWTVEKDGYRFHEWDGRQPTRAEVDEKRAAARDRMRRIRTGKKDDGSEEVRANETRTDSEGSSERSSEVRPEQDSSYDKISTKSDRNPIDLYQSVTESDDGTDEAIPQVDDESEPDVRENFARSDTNPVPSLPGPYNSGHLGGNGTKVTRELRASAPPKYHPRHPDGYVDGCGQCDRMAARYEAWLLEQIPEPDAQPPRYCPRHPGGSPDPCRGCQDAREAHQLWQVEHARQQAEATAAERRHAAEARADAITACPLCDADGYAGLVLCDHDPETAERNRRGAEAARAALREARAAKEARPA